MSPIGKQVSESVMERVSVAIDALKIDDTLPRTKRELERLSGLSHATVARAFVQDAAVSATPGVNRWRLTDRFATMTVETGGRTSLSIRTMALEHQLEEKNDAIRKLEQTVDQQAQALYAIYVRDLGREKGVTPIGVNRSRRRPQ